MKHSIQWYEEGIKNYKQNRQETFEQIERMKLHLDKMDEKISFTEAQINRAKKEGKDSFDRNTYNVKRKK